MSTIGSGRRIVEFVSQGYTVGEISKLVNIPENALVIIIRSPLVQGEIARLRHAA